VRAALAATLGLRLLCSALAAALPLLWPGVYPWRNPLGPDHFHLARVAPGAAHAAPTLRDYLIGPWDRWDAAWFVDIARHGYASYGSSFFMPLYPLLIRLLAPPLGGDALAAGLLISTVAAFWAFLALYRLAERLAPGRGLGPTTLLVACLLPTAFFLMAAYTESLFLALALWAILAALDGRWWRAAALGALAALTRQQGIVLAALALPPLWPLARRGWAWLRALPFGRAALAVASGGGDPAQVGASGGSGGKLPGDAPGSPATRASATTPSRPAEQAILPAHRPSPRRLRPSPRRRTSWPPDPRAERRGFNRPRPSPAASPPAANSPGAPTWGILAAAIAPFATYVGWIAVLRLWIRAPLPWTLLSARDAWNLRPTWPGSGVLADLVALAGHPPPGQPFVAPSVALDVGLSLAALAGLAAVARRWPAGLVLYLAGMWASAQIKVFPDGLTVGEGRYMLALLPLCIVPAGWLARGRPLRRVAWATLGLLALLFYLWSFVLGGWVA
jgi:hypothetical protein